MSETGAMNSAAQQPPQDVIPYPRKAGSMPLVSLVGVAVDYGSQRVLEPTDLSILEGEFLTILGPSGSGKTTILKMIGGFLSPSAGRIMHGREDITDRPPERRPFNTVFQDYALFPHMSVAENVSYSLRLRGVAKAERADEARRALELVGLPSFDDRRIAQLSGGQQQRVALARAIVAKPSMILLDEPLSALDAALRHQMQSFLKSIQRQLGTTFVFVTHDQQEALAMSDRIVIMNAGRISQIGSPSEVYDAPANGFVATFIGRNNLIDAGWSNYQSGTFETAVGTISSNASKDGGSSGPCQLAIRPECVSLRLRGPELAERQRNRIEGEITEVIYAGTHFGYKVAAGPDRSVTFECSSRADKGAGPFAIGDEVEISFDPEDVRMVAR